MAEKFKNKYRIPSARLNNWDYRWVGVYFITICTDNREHYFGEIKNGKMHLSNLGVIADIFWHDIPVRKPFVKLGEYVIMPNHMHGILIIDSQNDEMIEPVETLHDVETLHATSLRKSNETSAPHKNKTMSRRSPKSNSVSTIIRSYKSAVTRHANRLGIPNGWQMRFYDHIVRDPDAFHRISNYIKSNVENWKKDTFYGE